MSRFGRHRTSQGTGPPRKPAYCLLSKLLSESELVKRLFLRVRYNTQSVNLLPLRS
nr:MAG TPA: hypothetical protein [Caudoviricetes sp.]